MGESEYLSLTKIVSIAKCQYLKESELDTLTISQVMKGATTRPLTLLSGHRLPRMQKKVKVKHFDDVRAEIDLLFEFEIFG